MDPSQLDRIDLKIVEELRVDGRLSINELARRVGLSKTPCQARLKRLMADGVRPRDVVWSAASGLFAQDPMDGAPPLSLSRAMAERVRLIVCHSDPERYALLYRSIWRVKHGEPYLAECHADPLVHRLQGMEKSVRRDLHKMHAFVRFREVADEEAAGGRRHVAWFEPAHHVLRAVAPFFVRRFAQHPWAILTPRGCLLWDGQRLSGAGPARREDAPPEDAGEALWLTYYRSIFNPARLKVAAMKKEMPVR